MIAVVSRSSDAHRSRSRANAAAKASARSIDNVTAPHRFFQRRNGHCACRKAKVVEMNIVDHASDKADAAFVWAAIARLSGSDLLAAPSVSGCLTLRSNAPRTIMFRRVPAADIWRIDGWIGQPTIFCLDIARWNRCIIRFAVKL